MHVLFRCINVLLRQQPQIDFPETIMKGIYTKSNIYEALGSIATFILVFIAIYLLVSAVNAATH